MTEAAESLRRRIRHYVLDGSDRDLARLLTIAEVLSGSAREALCRAGDITGWRVIECGCGPLGALAVLSELVGPAGTVAGIDFSEATVARARSVLATLGAANVEVMVGDVHTFDAARAGGPFDLAYSRFMLMHQADPGETLARIAGLLRPGGWLIAQEAMRLPTPMSYPPRDIVGRHWDLAQEAATRSGVAREGVERLPVLAAQAGFEVVARNGIFTVMEPSAGFAVHAGSTAALKNRIVSTGVATAEEVDELESALLQAAASTTEGWVSGPFMLDLALRKL